MAGLDSIMQAAKFLPASVAVKALQKFNPKFKNYFADAAAYGFDVNNALDYLNQRFESQHAEPFENMLEKRTSNGQARPDELIAKKEIQQSKMLGKIGRSAVAFGTGALLGGIPGAAAGAVESISQERPEQMQQKQPGPREQALKRHSEMNKRKKLIDQLTEDFENEYGQGNVSATRFPGASEGASPNERIQQGTPGQSQNLERLIQLLQQRKQRGL